MISLTCALAALDCLSLPIPEDLKVLRERELEQSRAEVTVVTVVSSDDEPGENQSHGQRQRGIAASTSSSASEVRSVEAAAGADPSSSSSSRKRLASRAIHSETGSDMFPVDSLERFDSQSQSSFGTGVESRDNGIGMYGSGNGSGPDESCGTGGHGPLSTDDGVGGRNSGGISRKKNSGDDSRKRGFGQLGRYKKSQSFGSNQCDLQETQASQDLSQDVQTSQGRSDVAVLRRKKSQTNSIGLNQCADDLVHLDPETLQQFSKDTLCSMLQTLGLALGSRNEALHECKTVNRRLKRQCEQQEKNLASLRDLVGERSNTALVRKVQRMILSSTLELNTNQSGKRLTAESSLAVGIRRSFSNIAAADFGATVLMSISQQTVCRCEVKAASASRGAFQSYIVECLEQARQISMSPDSNLFSILGISIRADATNSGIWRREKLHVCEIAIGYTDSQNDPHFGNTSFAVHRHLYLGFFFPLLI